MKRARKYREKNKSGIYCECQGLQFEKQSTSKQKSKICDLKPRSSNNFNCFHCTPMIPLFRSTHLHNARVK
jgi:hypothetical protein